MINCNFRKRLNAIKFPFELKTKLKMLKLIYNKYEYNRTISNIPLTIR